MPAHDVFHAAVRQGVIKDPERILYLAVPKPTYTAFFTLLLAQTAVKRHAVHLIVYDLESEALVQWIK